MTRISNYDTEMNRAMVAREEFLAGYCFWWPAIYKAQMPVTYDGQSLLKAKQAIEAMMRDDFAAFDAQRNSPWHPVATAPDSKCVDWSKVNGQELYALGLEMDRPLGMPASPKQGFHEHPDVVSAWADSHRTAEYVAFMEEQRAKRAWEAATHIYVEAANPGGDEATVRKSKDGEVAAGKAHAAAKQDYDRLRKNPAKGLKIVPDPLTDDERIAERKSVKI